MRQFAENLVAVRARGEDLEKSVLIDPGSGLVYGDVPWWTMGTWAFVETAKGMKTIEIPPGPPDRNKAETTMTIGFSEDNAVITIRWTKVMRGQEGVVDRRRLRSFSPRDRQETIDKLCGESSRLDLTKAEASGIDDINVPYSLTCEGEYSSAKVDAKSSVHQYALSGLWVDVPPQYPASVRRYPLVFSYPRTDQQVVDIRSPRGFRARTAPLPTTIESPFGTYDMKVSATDSGFHVERKLVMSAIRVLPDEYAGFREFLAAVKKGDMQVVEFARSAEGAQ